MAPLVLCILGALCAIGILGYQVYIYLRLGYWVPISVVTALGWLNSAWALAPTEWLGLHKVLGFLPLSGTSFGISVLVAWIVQLFDKD